MTNDSGSKAKWTLALSFLGALIGGGGIAPLISEARQGDEAELLKQMEIIEKKSKLADELHQKIIELAKNEQERKKLEERRQKELEDLRRDVLTQMRSQSVEFKNLVKEARLDMKSDVNTLVVQVAAVKESFQPMSEAVKDIKEGIKPIKDLDAKDIKAWRDASKNRLPRKDR